MNFGKFITFRVVQEDQSTVIVAELGERRLESYYVICTLRIQLRVRAAGQRFDGITGQAAFLNNDQALPAVPVKRQDK